MAELPQPSPDYPVCDRSTLFLGKPFLGGGPCGRPRLWEAPACLAHLTKEEEAARASLRPSMRGLAIAIFNGREEPACWSWPIPAIIPVFASDDAAGMFVIQWHEWQCAVCGSLHPEATDHDHRTGLVRGELCRSCNVREGKSDDPIFQNYRQRNPASILGIGTLYWSPWTGYAAPEPEVTAADQQARRAVVDQLHFPSPDELDQP